MLLTDRNNGDSSVGINIGIKSIIEIGVNL